MKPKSPPKSPAHQHPHPLAHFLGCCLTENPTPLSPKIQSLRQNLHLTQPESITIEPDQPFTISKDMVVGDILANFPQTRALLQDLHPLGLLSPALFSISLEIFFADLPAINPDQICQELTFIINPPKPPNA